MLMIIVFLPVVGALPGAGVLLGGRGARQHVDARAGADGGGVHEDAIDALVMMGNSSRLLMTVMLYVCSIAVFNFCALSISKARQPRGGAAAAAHTLRHAPVCCAGAIRRAPHARGCVPNGHCEPARARARARAALDFDFSEQSCLM
jgi:hypothetical protein